MKRFALSMVVGLAFVALFLAGSSHAGGLYIPSLGVDPLSFCAVLDLEGFDFHFALPTKLD